MKQSLARRGFDLGEVNLSNFGEATSFEHTQQRWKNGEAVLLRGYGQKSLNEHTGDLIHARDIYTSALEQGSCESFIERPPYENRLKNRFEFIGTSQNQGSQQEIETLYFDALEDGQTIAEDFWLKISKLSYFGDDHSLRFRFSFGEDFEEDVAADKDRQLIAAELTEDLFPESKVISKNLSLHSTLREILGETRLSFVERIVYFNAPQGGAYFHHDFERGHAGVVYAQLSGETFWLAIPRNQLVQRIHEFITTCLNDQQWPDSFSDKVVKELSELDSANQLGVQLDSLSHSGLIHLMNETEAFVQGLIQQGYGFYLKVGDIILLPQQHEQSCCWHSVFCLSETAGEALSFAIRVD